MAQRSVRTRLKEIEDCYATAIRSAPKLRGTVTIHATLDAQGEVAAGVVKKNTTRHDVLGLCVDEAVQRWTFPKPPGGDVVTVTVTFIFSPT